MSHQDPLHPAHEKERPNLKTILACYLEWPADYLRIGDHPFSFVRLTCGSHLSAIREEGLGPFPAHLATKAAGGAS